MGKERLRRLLLAGIPFALAACGSSGSGPTPTDGGGCAPNCSAEGGAETSTDGGPPPPFCGPPGSLDPTFGMGGRVTIDPSTPYAAIASIALQGDGKIVVASGVGGPQFNAWVVKRLLASGSLDAQFGTGGTVVSPSAGHIPFPTGIAFAGPQILVAVADIPPAFVVEAYGDTGQPDPTFGTQGIASATFPQDGDTSATIIVRPDGKILVSGQDFYGPGAPDVVGVARLLPAGTVDSTFGTNGAVNIDFKATSGPTKGLGFNMGGGQLALLPDHRMFLGGGYYPGNQHIVMAGALLKEDGTLDTSFGSAGMATADFGPNVNAFVDAVALQADGKLLLAGGTGPISDWVNERITSDNFGVARLNADGSPDMSFGPGGEVTTDFSSRQDGVLAMTVQADGRILAAGGSAAMTGSASVFAIARYCP